MTARRATWSLVLADLSLILFVITAGQAAQSAAKEGPGGKGQDMTASRVVHPPSPGVPQAFYVAGPGAPNLASWIAAQQQGGQAQVTILSSYKPGEVTAAFARALDLAREAQATGRAPRVVVEPGDGGVRAILAYDHP